MKSILFIKLSVLLLLSGVQDTFAQNGDGKHRAEEVYAFFEKYSPGDVVEYAYLAVEHFTPVAKKAMNLSKHEEEKLFRAELKKFNSRPLRFRWEMFPFIAAVIPARCDEGRVVAHPIKQFSVMMNQKDFLTKYKDVKGKKVFNILCRKIENKREGAWSIQFQWWPETDKPLTMGMYMISIPNTPYEIHTFYPTRKYTEDQLNNHFSTKQ